ncbi:hypothetical protein [Rufibacter sp. LB8]|nr:hypothetical protein [Rufibacter sp. LB8]
MALVTPALMTSTTGSWAKAGGQAMDMARTRSQQRLGVHLFSISVLFIV